MERRKKRRRLIEIVKDVLIALLALSAVYLTLRTQIGGLQAFINDAGCDEGQKDLHHNLQRGEPDAGPGSALILFELMQYGLHFLHSL